MRHESPQWISWPTPVHVRLTFDTAKAPWNCKNPFHVRHTDNVAVSFNFGPSTTVGARPWGMAAFEPECCLELGSSTSLLRIDLNSADSEVLNVEHCCQKEWSRMPKNVYLTEEMICSTSSLNQLVQYDDNVDDCCALLSAPGRILWAPPRYFARAGRDRL